MLLNKSNSKGLERFKKNKKQKRIVIGTVIGILLVLGIIKLYKTYAIYEEKVNFTILKGQVPSFGGDINLAMTLNNQKINTMPPKSNAYNVKVTCEGATGTWSNTNWNITIGSFTSTKVSCTLDFTLIYDAYIKNSNGTETKYENTNASGLDRYVPTKGNYAVTTTCANSSWNKTTWSLDVTGNVTTTSKCKVVFEPMYTYAIYTKATKTETAVTTIPTDKPYTKVICTSGSTEVKGTWNSTTKVVDFVSTPPVDTKCKILFSNDKFLYEEEILNGAAPVLASGLIPVTIADDGKVTQVDAADANWYSYANKKWANAVILVNTPTKTYSDGQQISEDDIESYFVWIPKYKYKLWTVTTDTSGTAKKIDIKFGLENTKDATAGECTTPGWTESNKTYNGANVSGAKGNCVVGDYMTHPAFLSFDTNGIWVGKFETGYRGATSTATAQQNPNITTDAEKKAAAAKIIIKPNVYSWRSIPSNNMFNVSYNYKRNLNSHLIKNTEWGAVTILVNSVYGRCNEGGVCENVTGNTNHSYITGQAGETGYFNASVLASTTKNRYGIYDMSGGAWDVTSGNYNYTGTSGAVVDFTSYAKYIDKYTGGDYNARILGDAMGECAGWYGAHQFLWTTSTPWIARGARDDGRGMALNATMGYNNSEPERIGFRISLAF